MNAVEVQELEWIKIGVATGVCVAYGKRRACQVGQTCQGPVCKPLVSQGERTTMGRAAVMYGDKGYLFHKGRTF